MAVFQRIFSVADVADIHLRFNRLIKEAQSINKLDRRLRQRGLAARTGQAAATERELLRAYALFNRELEALARDTAKDADLKIRQQLVATKKRVGRTGKRPGLMDVIHSRPVHRFRGVATGEVGVADEAWLDRAVNPLGPQYGPYWFAQEFGSTAQLGRMIRGFFGDAGGPIDVPRAQFKGGGGPHPIFYPAGAGAGASGRGQGPGTRGGRGGWGTIDHPIQARHFIRDGATRAFADYLVGVARVESNVLRRLRGI